MARATEVVVGGAVAVSGLTDAARQLGRVNLRSAVARGHRKVTKPITEEARSRWRAQRIRPTLATQVIAGSATQAGAALRLRYSRIPFAAGVEYGSKRFRQFRPWTGNQFSKIPGVEPGYVVTPAIADRLDEILETYADTIVDEIAATLEA